MFDKSRAMRREAKEKSTEESVVFPPIEDGKPLTQGQNGSHIPKTSGQVLDRIVPSSIIINPF